MSQERQGLVRQYPNGCYLLVNSEGEAIGEITPSGNGDRLHLARWYLWDSKTKKKFNGPIEPKMATREKVRMEVQETERAVKDTTKEREKMSLREYKERIKNRRNGRN